MTSEKPYTCVWSIINFMTTNTQNVQKSIILGVDNPKKDKKGTELYPKTNLMQKKM